MTKNISLTIEEEMLQYIDELADINGRSRSAMINWLIKKSYEEDKALDEEASVYNKIAGTLYEEGKNCYGKKSSTNL